MFLKVVEPGCSDGFRLIQAAQVSFGRDRDHEGKQFAFADVTPPSGGFAERVVIKGTAYVLNDGGDTIEKFSERQERKG